MNFLYIDESGEFGAAPRSSNHMLITVLSTPSPKALKKRVWKVKAQLYAKGWPKDIEIKGTSLWGAKHIPSVPEIVAEEARDYLHQMINAICRGETSVYYSIVRKSRISQRILGAPYGIAYNWQAGNLLVRAYEHYEGALDITVDQRNKETHHKLKFDGYLETRLYTDCEHAHDLSIRHAESHDEFGLQAVDFISWGLFRHFEHGDSQFCETIRPSVRYVDDWYSQKHCPGK